MQPTLWRGALGAFLLAALAVPPMVSPAAAATELLIGTSHQTADAELPATVGIELGIFEKHGLDVKITDFGGGSRMIQAMTAGSIGIGVGAGSEMALIAKGAPVLAVCEDASSLPYFSVGLPYDSPIHSLDQLKGKKIGVTTEGSLTAWLARELARHQGWGPDALNIVAIGGKPEAVAAALRAHLIDANIGSTLELADLEEHKIARALAPVSRFVGRTAGGVIYASHDIMKQQPDTVRRYLAAYLETMRYMSTHKDETVAIESRITHYPPEIVAKEYDIDEGMFTKDCRFDAESLANLKRSFLDQKLLSEPPDMSKLYTAEYLPHE
ncbi:MAG TPA: ABC transporter substrate-binding protein [Stellaceae bacterium]|nr:ABC transporter substrate-binding protein [Stellaceae bacterium]